MINLEWKYWSKNEINAYLSLREGEIKLGEKVTFGDLEDLKNSKAKYVLLCVPEDIGIRANHGVGGADSNYKAFFQAFLNIQSHETLTGEEVFLYGYLNPKWSEELEEIKEVNVLRYLTEKLDVFLEQILQEIFALNKLPILIGGGHNNAYPLMKAAYAQYNEGIHVVNIDAHADSRALEGRHSGNSFSYAINDGALKKYALIAWQEAYNNSEIIKNLKDKGHLLFSYEDLFLRKNIDEEKIFIVLSSFQNENRYGLELDVDTIEGALSSAMTPLGISPQQAYNWVYRLAKHEKVLYFHLPEGVLHRKDGAKDRTIGKLLSFLVQAFIKGNLEKEN